MGPLRAFGVPTAAIVDIDILKDGGSTWTGWLRASSVPAPLLGGLGQVRGDLQKRFNDLGIDMKTGGVDALTGADNAGANALFDTLREYGVFVARKGELEKWLAHLKVPGKKTDWAIGMLDRMKGDPSDPLYVHPGGDDVWAFLGAIAEWIRNPSRKGMPQ